MQSLYTYSSLANFRGECHSELVEESPVGGNRFFATLRMTFLPNYSKLNLKSNQLQCLKVHPQAGAFFFSPASTLHLSTASKKYREGHLIKMQIDKR